MIAYGIGVLPIIQYLRYAHPHITQPWYANDVGKGGKFGIILAYFQDLQAGGSPRGYFSEPTKSILVVALQNMARVKEFFWGMGIKVVTGSCYLGDSSVTGRPSTDG